MLRITLILHLVVGTALAGSLIIAGLVMGLDALWPILGLGIVGYIVAVPVSWLIARAMMQNS